ncbi:MAG: DUF2312 domain-containing protein [Alphaproteobacteria bacterium]|nr:DUF2312 domain-containing protein [Alphaproteobacteria bacterium]
MAQKGGIAADRLRSFVQRIEKLEEDRAAIGADIREVLSEAKAAGFDVATLRQVVQLRRMDRQDLQERDALLELYRDVLNM